MKKLTLLNHILKEAKAKGACKAAYNPYEKAMQSKDYETASQIVLGYYYWLKDKGIIHITCKEIQDILKINIGLTYCKSGQIMEKSTYKKGKLHGEYIFYYKSGQTRIKANFKNDNLDGEYLRYYESGQIWVKANYKNDELHGEYIEYSENSAITRS